MKRVLAFCISLLAFGLATATVAGAAGAAGVDTGPNGEKAETTSSIEANKGSLSQSRPTPATWHLHGVISEPGAQLGDEIMPLWEIHMRMPAGVSFNPGGKTKPCPDSKMNAKTNLDFDPETVIKKCPKSVIGNGTAYLQVGHKINVSELKDPVLVVFDAGRVAKGAQKGQARIKIYGMSKGTGHGVYMEGVLQKDGTLNISVPWLTDNAAVTMLDLNIPGAKPVQYNKQTVWKTVGQDPDYLRATCPASGKFEWTSSYLLGYTLEDGTKIGDPVLLDAPPTSYPCTGTPDAWINGAAVKGPGKVKRRKGAGFKVTVNNAGVLAAKGVTVIAKGKGVKGKTKVKLGNVAAKKKKVAKLRLVFTKKGKSKVTFTVKSGNGGSVKAVKTVKVR